MTVHFDNFPQKKKIMSEANEFSWRGTQLTQSKKIKSAIATAIFWIARNSFVILFHMQITQKIDR